METTADRNAFHALHPRSAQMALWGARAAIRHLRTRPYLNHRSAVLDFGCGYFHVGVALAPEVARVDGIEIDPYALNVARSRAAAFANATIHSRNEDVPLHAYDLIVANSVFQYLENDGEILRTLKLFRGWLKPGGAGRVLLIDMIPQSYSPARDALRSMWVAVLGGIPVTMARFLWNAATSPHGRIWHKIDPQRMHELANEAGFAFEKLRKNLAPSLQRYSCELKAI